MENLHYRSPHKTTARWEWPTEFITLVALSFSLEDSEPDLSLNPKTWVLLFLGSMITLGFHFNLLKIIVGEYPDFIKFRIVMLVENGIMGLSAKFMKVIILNSDNKNRTKIHKKDNKTDIWSEINKDSWSYESSSLNKFCHKVCRASI